MCLLLREVEGEWGGRFPYDLKELRIVKKQVKNREMWQKVTKSTLKLHFPYFLYTVTMSKKSIVNVNTL